MRCLALSFLWLATACTGLSWETRMAETRATRLAMLQSVEIGRTTERQFTARWGQPTQRVREGGQTELVYRAITDVPARFPQVGFSDRFVIVTFQYGKAVGARSNDTELCRATFPPRPPGFGFSTPAIVRPIGTCPEVGRDASAAPEGGAYASPDGPAGPSADEDGQTGGSDAASDGDGSGFWRPLVPEERYVGGRDLK